MNKLLVKSENKVTDKPSRKFHGVLRRLAKSDTSILNTMKVTVYKDDIIEDKKHIFIAKSMFMNYQERWINHISTESTNVNINENINENLNEDSIIENEVLSPHCEEFKDYPDSSDFDDDE